MSSFCLVCHRLFFLKSYLGCIFGGLDKPLTHAVFWEDIDGGGGCSQVVEGPFD